MSDESKGGKPSIDAPYKSPSLDSASKKHGIPRDPQPARTTNDLTASETKKELHWLEKLNFGGQLSLVIVGIIAACIYGCQLKTMKSQLTEMSKQYPEIQQSADAAKVAADTAKNSLTQSIDFFRTDERAWIVIDGIDKTTYPGTALIPAESFKYKIWPKNVGKTVARNVRILVENAGDGGMLGSNERGIRMSQDQLFRENDNPRKRAIVPDQPGPQTLAPGARSPVPIYGSGTAPYNGMIQYVLGRIDYVDAFGAVHWTHFCFVISTGGELAHCQYGNDDDNNPESKAP
jgi:hypothetical protein